MVSATALQGALGAAEPSQAMRATAAAERLRRALAGLSVRFTQALQPTAEALGQGLQLSNEAIQLFSEEVRVPSLRLPLRMLHLTWRGKYLPWIMASKSMTLHSAPCEETVDYLSLCVASEVCIGSKKQGRKIVVPSPASRKMRWACR